MRKSTLFLSVLAVQALLLAAAGMDARTQQARGAAQVRDESAVVRELGLTDLCLFTEARYTRHPSQADLNTPFQDHPLALEHFPSGSLVTPPPQLKERHATVD